MVRENSSDGEETDNKRDIEPVDWVTAERKRSILTRDDRDYIRGVKNLSGGTETRARNRIRHRVDDGIRDLAFLSAIDYLDPMRFNYWQTNITPYAVRHALQSVLTVWDSYVQENSSFDDPMADDNYIDDFTQLLESSIADVITRGGFAEVDSVEIKTDCTTAKQSALRKQLIENDVVLLPKLLRYQELADDEDRQQLAAEMAENDDELMVFDPVEGETRTYPLHKL